MNNIGALTHPAKSLAETVSRPQLRSSSTWLTAFLVLALLAVSWPARAQEPEDEYLRIFDLIQEADQLNARGKPAPALARYKESQIALLNLQRGRPDWNPKAVAYRLNDVTEKLTAVSPKVAASAEASAGSVK